MPEITSGSDLPLRREAQLKLLADAAARLEQKNEAAALAARRRLAREFDVEDRSGWAPRAYRTRSQILWDAPAQREMKILSTFLGRPFHGGGKSYGKPKIIETRAGPSRRSGSAAEHHRYIHSHGSGAAHSAYIERDGQFSADRSLSNISGDFQERMRFFELVEVRERDAGGNAVTIDFQRASPQLIYAMTKVHDQPALDRAMTDHAAKGSSKPRRISIEGDLAKFRNELERNGAALSASISKGRRTPNDQCLAADGIAFHQQRAGRTHFRWVFALPHEFSPGQRRRVLEKLGAYMEREKFMYSAVIHEPDPHNDERNHHIHLIFYDRPCRKLDGTEADFRWVPKHLHKVIAAERDAGLFEREWDFAMERHYRSGRNWKTHYPFAAPKSRDGLLRHKDYKKRLRAVYAAMVNEVASDFEVREVFNHRSYKDRGALDQPVTVKLGTSLHMAELCGFTTEPGSANERTQSSWERQQIVDRWTAEDERLRDWLQSVDGDARASDDPKIKKAEDELRRRIREAQHRSDLQKLVELLELELARERSRAERTKARLGRASTAGSRQEQHIKRALADEAASFLAALTHSNASILQAVDEAKAAITRLLPLPSANFMHLSSELKAIRELERSKAREREQKPAVASPPPIQSKAVKSSQADRGVSAARPSIGHTKSPDSSEADRQKVINVVCHFQASPAGLRRSATSRPGAPRFEVTEQAGQIAAAAFNEVAANPRLHFLLDHFFPNLPIHVAEATSAASPSTVDAFEAGQSSVQRRSAESSNDRRSALEGMEETPATAAADFHSPAPGNPAHAESLHRTDTEQVPIVPSRVEPTPPDSEVAPPLTTAAAQSVSKDLSVPALKRREEQSVIEVKDRLLRLLQAHRPTSGKPVSVRQPRPPLPTEEEEARLRHQAEEVFAEVRSGELRFNGEKRTLERSDGKPLSATQHRVFRGHGRDLAAEVKRLRETADKRPGDQGRSSGPPTSTAPKIDPAQQAALARRHGWGMG